MTPGEKALRALAMFYEIRDLGDFIYDIRDREGQGWDGPKVKQWSDACSLAQEALKEEDPSRV